MLRLQLHTECERNEARALPDHVVKAVKRVLEQRPDALGEIKDLDGRLTGYQSIKPTAQCRQFDENEYRVVFQIRGNTMFVLAAGERESVYRKAHSRLKGA